MHVSPPQRRGDERVGVLDAVPAGLNVLDLVGADEFTYLVVLFMILVLGPGKLSVDALIARKLEEA